MKVAIILKVILTIVLSLTVLTAFIAIGQLSDLATAPFKELIEYYYPEDFDDPDALLYIAYPSEDETEPEDCDIEDDNIIEDEFIDPGYVLIRMAYADIARGSLILINHDYAFVFPDRDNNDLVNITNYITDSVLLRNDQTILSSYIIPHLNEMMDAFHDHTGITNVIIRDAFRSLSGQQQIFDTMVRRWGRTGALGWAALPGHSEHHTGFAIDFGVRRAGNIEMFDGTGAFSWIPRNSHNFGFILRYPQNRTSITRTNFEPWHYRFVGIPHAAIMRANNWVLEEYIENIRGYTYEEPLLFTFNDIEYMIYFTTDLEIRLPYDVEFTISGNNIDGFIVTIWENPHRIETEIVEEV